MQIRLTFSVIMNHEMLRMRFLFSGSVSGENEVHKMVLFHYTIIFDWNYAKELLTEGGCGRFLGPELSNSKTASILHRTQTP